jgi:hypothetical protein
MLWLAVLASNIGTWMQTVGASVDRLSDPAPRVAHLFPASAS